MILAIKDVIELAKLSDTCLDTGVFAGKQCRLTRLYFKYQGGCTHHGRAYKQIPVIKKRQPRQ